MFPKPHPVPLSLTLRSERELTQHRRLLCPLYRQCLDEAMRRRWESFSCERCPHASARPDASAELRRVANARTVSLFDADG